MNSPIERGRFVASFVETSIAKTATPLEAEEFITFLKNRPSTINRMIGTTLCKTAMTFPKTSGLLINRRLPKGLTYAGAGGESVVYRNGDDVIKVNKRSIHLTEDQRQSQAQAEDLTFQTMQSYLGDILLPQTVSVEPHPVNPKLRAMQIRQPYVAYDDLGSVFPTDNAFINRAALEAVLRAHPDSDESFYLLAFNGLCMADEAGLVPDTLRRGNLGITATPESSLVLVDCQPLRTANIEVQEWVVPQLEDLRQFIDPVAA